jgi:hypothetical protein
MTGGGCRDRKRKRPAPLGFCPLQRLWCRKSTNPGFPSPGSFPSRRFSRPQGFAPSGPLWAYSVPLTLLGFRQEGSRVGSAPLSGLVLDRILPAVGGNPKVAASSSARWCLLPKGSAPVRGWAEPRRTRFSNLAAPSGQSSPNGSNLRDGRNRNPCLSWLAWTPVARCLPRAARASRYPKVPVRPSWQAGPERLPDPEGPVGFSEVPDLVSSFADSLDAVHSP